MCDYCTMWQPPEFGGYVTMGEEIPSEFGDANDKEKEGYFVLEEHNGEIVLCSNIFDVDTAFNGTAHINFCPMCGRKLQEVATNGKL